MPEIAVLAEQFSVVGHDHEVGVLRTAIHELAHDLVQVFHAGDLLFVKGAELFGGEKFVLLAVLEEIGRVLQKIVKVLEHAVDPADVGQVVS